MATPLYVASAAVTTVIVLAVVGVVVRGGQWQGYGPADESLLHRLRSATREPVVWMLTFGLLLLIFGGGTVLWVSGVAVPGAELLGVGLIAAAVMVFGGALFIGVYATKRSRGRSAAQGAIEGTFLVGFLVVLLIVVKLLV